MRKKKAQDAKLTRFGLTDPLKGVFTQKNNKKAYGGQCRLNQF